MRFGVAVSFAFGIGVCPALAWAEPSTEVIAARAAKAELRHELEDELGFARAHRASVERVVALAQRRGRTATVTRRKLAALPTELVVPLAAIETEAEQRERLALRTSAAAATNATREQLERATQRTDAVEQKRLLQEARQTSFAAARDWQLFLALDPRANDAAESAFFLAEGRHHAVTLGVALDEIPAEDALQQATAAAERARDWKGAGGFLQPAALFVVDIAWQRVRAFERRHQLTGGKEGFPPRAEVETTGAGNDQHAVVAQIPAELLELVKRRDEYMAKVSAEKDVGQQREQFGLAAAEVFLSYGQLDEAWRRLEALAAPSCDREGIQLEVWRRQTQIAMLRGNVDSARALAQKHMMQDCPRDDTPLAPPPPVALRGFGDAFNAFQQASRAVGAERERGFRLAATLYEQGLKRDPSADLAPEAALNGAFAYRQVGELDNAIRLLELFVAAYGTDAGLDAIERNDPARYRERVKFLKLALEELAKADLMTFGYERAAARFEAIGKSTRLDRETRRAASHNAAILLLAMGENKRATAARTTASKLGQTEADKEALDLLFFRAAVRTKAGEPSGDRRALQALFDAFAKQHKNLGSAAHVVALALRQRGDRAGTVDFCARANRAFARLPVGPDGDRTLPFEAKECVDPSAFFSARPSAVPASESALAAPPLPAVP